MKNCEKYKTVKEREKAFYEYCVCKVCQKCIKVNPREKVWCLLEWLEAEADEPVDCPFCGANCSVSEFHAHKFDKEMVEKLTDRIEAAKREIETLRMLVEGLLKASSVDCASCDYDCGPHRKHCITKQAIDYLEGRRGEELSALRQGGMR